MATKKTAVKKGISNQKTPDKPSLEEDLKQISIPFDLYTAFSLAVAEMNKKKFTYSEMKKSSQPVAIFRSSEREEKISINITAENLLVKQFSTKNNTEKLQVIYVVKPSERNFNII